MNINVFCSAYSLDERYTAPAAEFARLLGERGHTLVWGGSHAGLMGLLADEVKEAGGRLVGVSVDFLAHKAYEGADELQEVLVAADVRHVTNLAACRYRR